MSDRKATAHRFRGCNINRMPDQSTFCFGIFRSQAKICCACKVLTFLLLAKGTASIHRSASLSLKLCEFYIHNFPAAYRSSHFSTLNQLLFEAPLHYSMSVDEPSLARNFALDTDTESISSSLKHLAVGVELYGNSLNYHPVSQETDLGSGPINTATPHPHLVPSNFYRPPPGSPPLIFPNSSSIPQLSLPNPPPHFPRRSKLFPTSIRPARANAAPSSSSTTSAYPLISSPPVNTEHLLPTFRDNAGNFYALQPNGTVIPLTPVSGNTSIICNSRILDHNPQSFESLGSTASSITRPTYAKAKLPVQRHSSYHHFRPLTSREACSRKLRDSQAQFLDKIQFNGLVDHSAKSRYGDLDTATLVLYSATSSARNSLRSSARASTRSEYSHAENGSFRDIVPASLPS